MENFLERWRKTKKQKHISITLHETCNDDDESCFACAVLVIGDPTYKIDGDFPYLYLHKSCAELPGKIQHPLHPQHPLTLRDCGGFICDGCRHVSFGYQYCCEECRFKLDFQCVSKNEVQALKERVEKHTVYHPHKLQLVNFHSPVPTYRSKHLVCCCCLKSCRGGRDPTYTCNFCLKSSYLFLIHKSCLDKVPRQVQSSFHPEHPLVIQLLNRRFLDCVLCNYSITGLALTCYECDIKFHVSCGSRTTRGLRLELHQHDMHYVISESPFLPGCTICEARCKGAFYRCVECDENVHMECIPLSEIVEHESHEYHPLKLTDSVVTHRDDDEYRCDICEEEGNIKHHSYYCNECNFIAHIECVHSEHQDTSPKISCLDPRGKGKAEEETDGAEEWTEDEDDAEEETDDAEEWTEDEVYEIHRSSQESWDSDDFCVGQRYHESNVDDSIENFGTKIEELALELEAVANLDPRIEKVKADMVKLVFQFKVLRKNWDY